MNILFLTMYKMVDINENNIYPNLMKKFHQEGHEVFIVSPCERREGKPTTLREKKGVHYLNIKTLNVQKTNVIEKGLGQILLEKQFKSAIKYYFGNIRFDVILYSTPPITFTEVIKWVKDKNPQAMTYLMLKDIFPQNAVDLGMLSKNGIKGLLYYYFRHKEKKMYRISDWIGCMSPANVKYVMEHNKEITPSKVEICPNSYEVPKLKSELSKDQKNAIRSKYGLPLEVPIFIYGGNLGKPQGILFLIECMKVNMNRTDCHFVIVGNGVDYPILESWYNANSPKSVSVFKSLPKNDYDQLVDACDVGMIFLDYRFTIPNYPSRLLPYLLSKMPIIAVTDKNCDTGKIAVKNGYGLYCESDDVNLFICIVNEMLKRDRKKMGERGYQFFLDNYTVQHTYDAIMQHM